MVQKGENPIFGQQSIDISPTDVVRYSCWGGQQTAPFFDLSISSKAPLCTEESFLFPS